MLTELHIRDLAIITDIHLELGSAFNVLTGETGAGKSIILDAVSLILGGRADTSLIRAGSDKAVVEATFHLQEPLLSNVTALLADEELESEDEPEVLHLAREVRSSGRTVGRINGQKVTVGLMRQVGDTLIGIHGQGDHLALLRPRSHLPLLDSYAGLDKERDQLTAVVKALRDKQKEMAELRRNERVREQQIDMYRFQIEEIEAADLQANEEAELRTERNRLANMEQLAHNSATAYAILSSDFGDSEVPSVSDLLGEAEAALSILAKLDETQTDLLGRVQGLLSEFADISTDLRDYHEGLEHDPHRLHEIEERLELINRLKRKYGATIDDVLATRDTAVVQLDKIQHSSERLAALDREIDRDLRQIGKLATALSQKRQTAAHTLSQTIERELQDLKMSARFGVDFQHIPAEPASSGAYIGEERLAFDHTGIDRVEFLISANPGEPLKPMAKVASGGETARLMLALKTALAQADHTPTLIFDEIDQGIGGRIGAIVGEKLWSLTKARHQVIVVTHLPQMAGFGDTHFHVSKQVINGRTQTSVQKLDHQSRIGELGAMLGTNEDLGKVGARSLLKEADATKSQLA
jgi:DNA repair protein RecN (Recombination protein N)